MRPTVITPPQGWVHLNLRELYAYRDLLRYLVLRDIKVLYKQTILGFSWAIIQPLLTMVIFTVVFGKMARIDSNGIPYPLFSYSAVVPWTYFSNALTGSTNSLITSSALVKKVYFPRLIVPLVAPLAKLVDFVIALAFLFAFAIYYQQAMQPWTVVLIPLLVLIMLMTASGLGFLLSGLAVQYRDVKFALSFVAQLMMYVAPVVFPASLVAEKLGARWYEVYGMYPMVGAIEGLRAIFTGRPIPWQLIGTGSMTAIVILLLGIVYYRRSESYFADVA